MTNETNAKAAVVSYYHSKVCPYCCEAIDLYWSLYCDTVHGHKKGFTFDWLVGKLQFLAYRCNSEEMS